MHGVLLLLALLLAGCGALSLGAGRPVVEMPYQPVVAKGYPADGLLVDADWVSARQQEPTLRLVDLSPWRRYQAGHLPGAVHLWWQDTLELHNPIYGMLVGAPERAELLGRLGIDQTTTVVAYDDEGGIWAARLVWLLEYTGHQRVHLLDGGPQAWLAAGRALTTDVPHVAPTIYLEREQPARILAYDEVTALLAAGGVLLDARTPDELAETWRGRLRRGRVPGAAARPWSENLLAPAGPFQPAETLRQLYAPALASRGPVAIHGLFGAAAAHDYVALRALGVADVRLYDGSWAEWGAHPDWPVAPLE